MSRKFSGTCRTGTTRNVIFVVLSSSHFRKLNRTNLLLVARIFGMTITKYRRCQDWNKAIEKFQAFLVSEGWLFVNCINITEPNEGDEQAVALLQQAMNDDQLKPCML